MFTRNLFFKFFLFVLMTLIASIITFSKKKKNLEKKMLTSTWYPRPRNGTLDPRQKGRLPCEQAWLRSVTKVWMTDTSACGRIEFHILWCRDCVSLIRSRFRDQVFDQVSTFGFGLRRSYGKKQRHESLRMRPTRKVEFRTRIGFSATTRPTTHV